MGCGVMGWEGHCGWVGGTTQGSWCQGHPTRTGPHSRCPHTHIVHASGDIGFARVPAGGCQFHTNAAEGIQLHLQCVQLLPKRLQHPHGSGQPMLRHCPCEGAACAMGSTTGAIGSTASAMWRHCQCCGTAGAACAMGLPMLHHCYSTPWQWDCLHHGAAHVAALTVP